MENDNQVSNGNNMTVVGRISQRGRGLTQDQKNRVVAYHNRLRKGEGASNMETLVCTLTVVLIQGSQR